MSRQARPLIAVAIAGLIAAGCGSAARGPAPARTAPGRVTPLNSSPDVGGAPQQSGHARTALGQLPARPAHPVRGHVRIGGPRVLAARATPSHSNDDLSATGAEPLNPCALVTLAEARRITGGALTRRVEAPLGPTCIYSGSGRAGAVTLAIESESLIQVTGHMRARWRLVVSGRRSVCGRLGTPMLLVALNRYQLLNVTAPCAVAERFAALAVGRLPS